MLRGRLFHDEATITSAIARRGVCHVLRESRHAHGCPHSPPSMHDSRTALRQKVAASYPRGEPALMGETLFSSTYQPDPASALDVLAFVLTPVEAFANDPDELAVVAELLGAAKTEAIERWRLLATPRN